jgi:DNA-directed RNA polymerase specialized sigma24 family protein
MAVDGRFHTTQWTLVLSAAADDPSHPALGALCSMYWLPVYAFVRRQGYEPGEAEDLTQSFFVRLVEKAYLAQADRARGRFRTFLLTSVKHFLSNERDRTLAQKRGGGIEHVAIDETFDVEERLTPEQVFEKRSALSLIDAAMRRLRDEYASRGQSAQFEALAPLLTGEVAREGAVDGATRVAIHRLRVRFRAVLRELVAAVVDSPQQVDDEIRHLLEVVSL